MGGDRGRGASQGPARGTGREPGQGLPGSSLSRAPSFRRLPGGPCVLPEGGEPGRNILTTRLEPAKMQVPDLHF